MLIVRVVMLKMVVVVVWRLVRDNDNYDYYDSDADDVGGDNDYMYYGDDIRARNGVDVGNNNTLLTKSIKLAQHWYHQGGNDKTTTPRFIYGETFQLPHV